MSKKNQKRLSTWSSPPLIEISPASASHRPPQSDLCFPKATATRRSSRCSLRDVREGTSSTLEAEKKPWRCADQQWSTSFLLSHLERDKHFISLEGVCFKPWLSWIFLDGGFKTSRNFPAPSGKASAQKKASSVFSAKPGVFGPCRSQWSENLCWEHNVYNVLRLATWICWGFAGFLGVPFWLKWSVLAVQ